MRGGARACARFLGRLYATYADLVEAARRGKMEIPVIGRDSGNSPASSGASRPAVQRTIPVLIGEAGAWAKQPLS